jgi:hypothetical protein
MTSTRMPLTYSSIWTSILPSCTCLTINGGMILHNSEPSAVSTPPHGSIATTSRSALQGRRYPCNQRETPAFGFRAMPVGGRCACQHHARAASRRPPRRAARGLACGTATAAAAAPHEPIRVGDAGRIGRGRAIAPGATCARVRALAWKCAPSPI